MTEISRPAALQRFFSTPEKPVSAKELLELRKADPVGFDKLADACLGALTPKKQAA
jgi:heterodisulfide reductase subunit B